MHLLTFASNFAIFHKNMDKYSRPNFPTAQHILEDISDVSIINLEEDKRLPVDEVTQNACSCFLNLKQLEGDLIKQNELNTKLQELNQKLVENIACMKTQAT